MQSNHDLAFMFRRISYKNRTGLSRTLYLTHLYFYHKNVGEMGRAEEFYPSVLPFTLTTGERDSSLVVEVRRGHEDADTGDRQSHP
jgi:hypothetical protein